MQEMMVKSAPRPSSIIIQEAMNLLSVMGGTKDAKNLLEQMLAVQKHNEELITQAKEIISEAKARDASSVSRELAVRNAEAEFEKSCSDSLNEITAAENSSREALRIERERLTEDQNALNGSLQEFEVTRNAHTGRVEAWKAYNKTEVDKLVKIKSDLEERSDNLTQISEGLDSREASLNILSKELDARKLKLDARDQKLLAVMAEEKEEEVTNG